MLTGLVLGLVFGTWNIVISILAPLMDDTPLTLASFYGPMFTAWGVAGGAAYRRTRRLPRAALSGATVALVTFIVLTAIVIARVNLSLDVMSQRPDWRNLVARFGESGFDSFRLYINYGLRHWHAVQARSGHGDRRGGRPRRRPRLRPVGVRRAGRWTIRRHGSEIAGRGAARSYSVRAAAAPV